TRGHSDANGGQPEAGPEHRRRPALRLLLRFRLCLLLIIPRGRALLRGCNGHFGSEEFDGASLVCQGGDPPPLRAVIAETGLHLVRSWNDVDNVLRRSWAMN